MPMSSDEFLAIQYDALRAAKLGPGSVATNTPRHLQNIWNCSWVGGRRELRGAGSLLYPKEERTRQGMLGNELSGSQHLSREIQIPQRNPLRATQHNREAAWMTPPLMWPAHTRHGPSDRWSFLSAETEGDLTPVHPSPGILQDLFPLPWVVVECPSPRTDHGSVKHTKSGPSSARIPGMRHRPSPITGQRLPTTTLTSSPDAFW
ncbi:predicted protein [Chaetomium globosum CBS 148.51]|uniref:Uncharacterized protein n=1 Tax=Chaetomium globosum (strain ATCC 6205 / CBS 148.51 / DSM 1962 / NBRC 6347 / NRRL 1970) TaxID=306901 RepID=Q2HE57_CHAGB|nr:uncharacterized protein CHGG_01497 [Chaetomium globosum CBS 148.51]EAQ93262.1 predicted protein [Chaetomium globosum CBS 148.51]